MRLQQADNNKQQQQQQQNKETDKQNWKRRLRDKADYGEYLWLGHCVRVFWWRFCCQSCMHKILYLCAAKYATHKKCSHPARRLRATFRTQMKLRTTEKKVARRSSWNYMPGKVCYLNVALSIFTFLLALSPSLFHFFVLFFYCAPHFIKHFAMLDCSASTEWVRNFSLITIFH